MTPALTAQRLRDPHQCLDGLASVAKRLTIDLDVRIRHTQLPPDELGVWDSVTRTLCVRYGAPLEDQLWLLLQLWQLLVVGPCATHAAIYEPHLRLVPELRAAIDHLG